MGVARLKALAKATGLSIVNKGFNIKTLKL
jgi:hypothetical protein